jgi:transcriptional regulator with XRE-family HTH domain
MTRYRVLSVDEAFGKALRHIRQQRGLSQEGMADLCQMDRSYMSALERGKQSPTLRTVAALCGYLNIDLCEMCRLTKRYMSNMRK